MERLIISTKDIRKNIEIIRRQAGVQLIGVVDHDGYGCGSRFLARALVSAGVQMLAFSDAETMKSVRADFPQVSMLLLSPAIGPEELNCIFELGAIATVGDISDLVRLNAAAEDAGEQVKVHLLIRTEKDGCGISLSQAERVASILQNCPYIEVDGAYTFLSADRMAKEKAVLAQSAVFQKTVGILNEGGIKTPVLHMAEGYAALRYPDIRYNAARIGEAVIGRLSRDKWQLAPVGEIETDVIGHTTVAAEEEKELKTSKERSFGVIAISSVSAIKAASKNGLLPGSGKKTFCTAGKKKYRVLDRCNGALFFVDCGKNELPEGTAVRLSADPRLVGNESERRYE